VRRSPRPRRKEDRHAVEMDEKALRSASVQTPESCGSDDYMVNAAAISDDGRRVVAGTYYQHSPG
jgi:hypothetical protein